VLVLAPTDEDARLTRQLLPAEGIIVHACRDVSELCREIREGAAALVVTEEIFAHEGAEILSTELGNQPGWSELPILLLAPRGADHPVARLAGGRWGALTTLERPVRLASLYEAIRNALRSRERQYQVRDHLEERRNHLRQLALSHHRMTTVLASMVDGYFSTDRRWRLLEINPAAEREVFGRPATELVGRELWECVPALLGSAGGTRLNQALPMGSTDQFETDFDGLLGGGRWFEVHVYVRSDCVEVYLRDISVRKRQELQLAAAKRTAEESSRAKDRFLAVLSHELRTPLTPVLMSLELLLADARLDPSVREPLQVVLRNVQLEAHLIDDMLDLTRIVRGKMHLALTVVDMDAVLWRAWDKSRHEADEKRIEVDLQLRATRRFVKGDEARLEQVFWNLLKNAIKFTPPGGTIAVETLSMPGEDGTWLHQTCVRDSGVGIDPELLSRLFIAFEQGDLQPGKGESGLGLGLAICRGIVEMHGGAIAAESAGAGLGATFTVTLPSVAAEESPDTEPAARPAEEAPRGLRILLVEDHEDSARLMQRILQRAGHQVIRAADVDTAWRAAQERGFDLLLSDISLPDGSGHDLMRRLRQAGPVRGIAISGFGMEADLARSRDAGFEAHLTKPVGVRELLDTIGTIAAQNTE